MKPTITHYCPDFRNRDKWVPVEHLIMFEKMVEPEEDEDDFPSELFDDDWEDETEEIDLTSKPELFYVTYSCGLDYEHPTSVKVFDRRRRYSWGWSVFIPLQKTVLFDQDKRLWLNPRGQLVYANKKMPDQDSSAVILGGVPNKYRFGYQVDARQMQCKLEEHLKAGDRSAPNEHLLHDLQSIVGMMHFCQAYDIDPTKVSQVIEEAMPCLTPNEAKVVTLRIGGVCGKFGIWGLIADEVHLSYERGRQLFKQAIKKLKRRIKSNQTRKRLGLPLIKGESPKTY